MCKQHAIFTACDGRYGTFLLEHWLVSLQRHVDLSNIDVHVLDYGLTASQRASLVSHDVTCHACVKDAHVANIRHRDLSAVLEHLKYEQVLLVDCGDVVFQADISGVFAQDEQHFRAVCEERAVAFHEFFMKRGDFHPQVYRKLLESLHGKPAINAGVIFGPAQRFRSLWHAIRDLTVGLEYLGTDQFVINHVLHRDGFRRLESKYNYVLLCMRSRCRIRNGVFHDADGQPIPIVHNAGMNRFAKQIRDFGYGPRRNRRKWFAPVITWLVIQSVRGWRWLRQAC